MYNRRLIVTAAELNTGNVKEFKNGEIHITIEVPQGRGRLPRKDKWHARELQIINNTGDFAEIIFFSTIAAKKDYEINPTDHTFIRIPNNHILQDQHGNMPFIKYILVKGTENGSATGDLILELLNYGK